MQFRLTDSTAWTVPHGMQNDMLIRSSELISFLSNSASTQAPQAVSTHARRFGEIGS